MDHTVRLLDADASPEAFTSSRCRPPARGGPTIRDCCEAPQVSVY